ncbi:MAG: fasciclin domain-containing protein [Congregibacter sp.]|nr:fasciclin domain-containing protein [Congregibacter sp.]
MSISASDAGVTVDGANVVTTDIEATNGVIHVIDTVILPGA